MLHDGFWRILALIVVVALGLGFIGQTFLPALTSFLEVAFGHASSVAFLILIVVIARRFLR